MQKATAAVRRFLARLHHSPDRRRSPAIEPDRRTLPTVASVHSRAGAHRISRLDPAWALRLLARPPGGRRDARLRGRIPASVLLARLGGPERVLSISVAALVLVASVLSVAPASGTPGGTGNVSGAGSAPRIAIGGGASGLAGIDGGLTAGSEPSADGGTVNLPGESVDGPPGVGPSDTPQPAVPSGPYLADGTLLKPVAVDTTVTDGASKLRPYVVQSGDTLTGIAARFGVSMMSIWWANSLTSKDQLHVGQTLLVPPVTGLVVHVTDGDTLASLASSTGVSADTIVAYNGLTDRNLIIGQTLVIPGGQGSGIPDPTPSVASGGGGSNSGGGGGPSVAASVTRAVAPPVAYAGGKLAWPVPGGYISQYFGCTGFGLEPAFGGCAHFHGGIDIAAPEGTPIIAAAGGTVIFAGWRNNGGGYQVWISDGNNVYTGYHHMSAVTVAIGETVARGQRIGAVGMTGNATGPHCHFEIWIGPIWAGGHRVNPLGYF